MEKLKTNAENQYSSLIFNVLKWIALSIAMAVPIGVIVGLFNILLSWGNHFRKDHEFMVFLLLLRWIHYNLFIFTYKKKCIFRRKFVKI